MGKGVTLTSRRLLWIVLGIVALAAVIFVGAALSNPKSSDPQSIEVARELEAQKLAEQAQTALSNNETSTALSLAQKALTTDPTNSTAKRVVAAAKKPAAPASNPSSGSDDDDSATPAEPAEPKPRDDSAYLKEIEDLDTLLPAAVKGWTMGQVVEQGADALVTLDPASGNTASSKVVRAIVYVHDLESASKASDFVTKVEKKTYAEDDAKVVIGVIPDAYFGTNGTAVAAVAFSRGRYAFEVLLTAKPGTDPATVKDTATTIADTLPAAR